MPGQKLEKAPIQLLKIIKMESEIPQNNSHQELVRAMDEGGGDSEKREKTLKDVTIKEWIVVAILCFINLINYMDRFTLAGKFFFILKQQPAFDSNNTVLLVYFRCILIKSDWEER